MAKKDDLENEFKSSLQALSQPAGVQIDLCSKDACVGDELVSRFTRAWKDLKKGHFGSLTPKQRGKIRSLVQYLSKISGEHNQEFWQDAKALSEDQRWKETRELAAAVLDSFAWPNQRPKQLAEKKSKNKSKNK